MAIVANVIAWTEKTFEPMGVTGLFSLAFMESSFFPVPPDILLIVLSLANPELALWFAFVCTVGSVIGGVFGYYIGKVGKQALLDRVVAKEKTDKVHRLFNRYEAWAVGIAAFTPIPFKVFTISAGVFYINLKKFILVSFIGRGGRFFLEAAFIMAYGERIVDFLKNDFNVLSILAVVVLVLGYIVYRKRRLSYSSVKVNKV